MKKIDIIIFILFIGLHCNGYGQIPEVLICSPDVDTNSIYPPVFKGTFHIDSIIDIGKAYLITVVSMDSIETNSRALSSLSTTGISFTIISFKNEDKSNGETIYKGGVYKFTLSPPGGIWALYGCKMNDWEYSQSVQDSTGITVKVPLPLIKTQLMVSLELNGLQYSSH